mmetsp:Transcript_21079/g.59252  ORF Transcript_21079/g.59252 Transcript_21079/m.59252 type:complete len:229 (-) Transcript_21079:100-786(-)
MAANKERGDHVFATDLPDGITEETLKGAFDQYGALLWCKVFAHKRAALLQFSSAELATFLVENMNGTIVHESIPQPITLSYSTGSGAPRKGSGAPGKGGGGQKGAGPGALTRWQPYGGKGASSIAELKKDLQAEGVLPGGRWQNDGGALHVGGLPADTTDRDVYEIFAPFGAIPSGGVKAMQDADGGCSGVAFVNFVDPGAAQHAMETLSGRRLRDGRTLSVKPKRLK